MTRNRTRAGLERTNRSLTAERAPAGRSSRNRLRTTACAPWRDATTVMELVPAAETDDPLELPIEGPSSAAARGEPRGVAEPSEDPEVVPLFLRVSTAVVTGDTPVPVGTGTVVDPPRVVVVPTGLDEDVVTEAVVRGVVTVTVVLGIVVGTVVDTVVGTVVGWVVGTVVDTVTVVPTVTVVTGVVTVVLTGSVIVPS
jgi:hypothetical protein